MPTMSLPAAWWCQSRPFQTPRADHHAGQRIPFRLAAPLDVFRDVEHSAGMCEQRFPSHSRSVLRRSALPITLTELKAIAAAAMIGLSVQPKNG
jgi:hypothetical protein